MKCCYHYYSRLSCTWNFTLKWHWRRAKPTRDQKTGIAIIFLSVFYAPRGDGFSSIKRFSTGHLHLVYRSICVFFMAGRGEKEKEWQWGCFFVWISMKSVRTGVKEGISSLIFREVLCPDEFQVRIAQKMMESCISCSEYLHCSRGGKIDACAVPGQEISLICRY